MTELFPIAQVAVLSPRPKWMQKHGLQTIHNDDIYPGDMQDGDALYPWCACRVGTIFPVPPGTCGYGNTEDEALSDWAAKRGVRLWNEEAICPA